MLLLWCWVASIGAMDGQIMTGFLVKDGVYNSELIAPYDILEHSRYRDPQHYFKCVLISPNGKPVHTAEGLTIEVDHSYETSPALDVLVIPSTMTSMTKDLEDQAYMAFVKQQANRASAVITLCDGAFPLAATGLLNGRKATTFPGDQDRFQAQFPRVELQRRAWFVQDGKFITGVGGARSYEPALFLTEIWQGLDAAKRSARGLVIDWDPALIPQLRFGSYPKDPTAVR